LRFFIEESGCLQVPPIGELQYQCPVFDHEVFRKVIVCVHDKQIGSWFVSPLKTCVQVYVFCLVVILQVGRKKQVVSESDVQLWAK